MAILGPPPLGPFLLLLLAGEGSKHLQKQLQQFGGSQNGWRWFHKFPEQSQSFHRLQNWPWWLCNIQKQMKPNKTSGDLVLHTQEYIATRKLSHWHQNRDNLLRCNIFKGWKIFQQFSSIRCAVFFCPPEPQSSFFSFIGIVLQTSPWLGWISYLT